MLKAATIILTCLLMGLAITCGAIADEAIVESDELIQQLQKQPHKKRTRGFIVTKDEAQVPTQQFEPPSATIYVYFISGTVDFADDKSRQQLDELGRALTSKSLSDAQFEISGHTDSIGSEAYNIDLSRRRAETVNRYLEDNFGYSSSSVKGYGESYPIAPNDTQEGRAKNRRVVITRIN